MLGSKTARSIFAALILQLFVFGVGGSLLAATHDSANMALTGRWASGPCYSVVASGNLVYVGDGAVVRIVDFTTPGAPVELGTVTVTGYVRGLALGGNRLCVASHYDGLRVIDVSDPTAPVEVGSLPTSDAAVDVAVQGDYAYVAASSNGVRIVDISNPSAPFEAAHIPVGWIFSVGVNGNLAFGGDFSDRLYIFDVSDPTDPSVVTFTGTNGIPYGIEAAGDHVYVAASGSDIAQMTIVDVADPALPFEAGRYSVLYAAGSGLGLAGNTVYFTAGRDGGLHLIDVSDPTAPTQLGVLDTPGWATDAAIVGSVAYVADRNRGVRAVDTSSPGAPVEIGHFETAGKASDVAAAGDHVYLLDREEGLRVLNIANPAAPFQIALLALDGVPLHIALAGDYAYVSADAAGLLIIDISNPAVPLLVGSHDVGPGAAAWKCVIDGNEAYVAAQTGGLQIVDVSNPAAPSLLGETNPNGIVLGVDLRWPKAYLATSFQGLAIVDVSLPATPVLLGIEDTYNARDVAVDPSGDFALVCDATNGFAAYNVTDPGNPFIVSSVWVPDYAREVDINGIFAYVATEESGLRVVDISALPTMNEVGYYDTADEAVGVYVDGFDICVADDDDGLWIFDNLLAMTAVGEETPPSATALRGAAPNPFNPQTSIGFALDQAGPVRLSIHDPRGRHLRTLVDETRAAGEHRVLWDGRDRHGRELSSGLYLVRFVAEGGQESAKLTLVR